MEKITFWNRSLGDNFKDLHSSAKGLSSHEARARLDTYGPNTIRSETRRNPIIEFLKHFNSPIIILLMVAAAISAAVGEVQSAVIIFVILLVSVVVDYIQEARAYNAAEKLKKSVALHVRALRDGKKVTIPAVNLVPGDVIYLETGNLVPADCILLEERDLFVNQAILTGETFPAQKSIEQDIKSQSSNLSDALNSVFMGSSIIGGTATALVCKTADETFLGAIGEDLIKVPPPSEFTIGITKFGYFLIRLTFFLVVFVLIANLYMQRPWLESVLFSLALAVGIMPEFLPMQISIALARGAILLAKKKVIVKRLAAIHDLGSMDILCTDKTGTLTQSKVTIERTVNINGEDSPKVGLLAYLNSYFQGANNNPLDQAILKNSHYSSSNYKKLDEVPFDFDSRYASTLLTSDKGNILLVKGAPESVLKLCSKYEEGDSVLALSSKIETKAAQLFQSLSEQGFRALAVAQITGSFKTVKEALKKGNTLTFVGFITFYDPPKDSAAKALKELKDQGVKVKVITGDNEQVALHICKLLNIEITGMLTGDEMLKMSPQALKHKVENTNLFSRVNPSQKNQIISMLKSNGHVVGFIGDGINDAPSIHNADVGMSVENAVDVAKEAADFILLKRDLGVIHDGVIEGRRTYANLMKYIMMLTSSNLGNMMSMTLATFLLPFIPMAPPQLLLQNLLYDFSQIPIPLDNVDQVVVANPHKWDIKFIQRFMIVFGVITSMFDLITFFFMLKIYGASKELFQTGWFIESLAATVLVIFIVRTRMSPFKNRPNPILAVTCISLVLVGAILPYTPIGTYFGFAAPSPAFLGIIMVIVLGYLMLCELVKKWFFARFG